VCSGATALATLASVLVRDPISLTVVRVVAGVALGATVPPALALITECAPRKARGLMVSLAMICAPLGLTACAALAAVLLPRYGWQSIFLMGGGATLAITVLFAWLGIESPRYLARQPEWRPRLVIVLQRLGISLDCIDSITVTQTDIPPSPRTVLSVRFLGLTLSTWLCFAAVFIATTALTSWVPTALTQAGYSVSVASGSISAWSLGGVAGTAFAALCLTTFGARRSSQGLAVGSAFSLLLAVVLNLQPAAGQFPVMVPMAASGFMMSAMITAIFAHATEVYPVEIRATGVGMAAMVGRSSAVVGSYGGIFVLDWFGIRGFFAIIAVLCALPLFLLWRHPRRSLLTVAPLVLAVAFCARIEAQALGPQALPPEQQTATSRRVVEGYAKLRVTDRQRAWALFRLPDAIQHNPEIPEGAAQHEKFLIGRRNAQPQQFLAPEEYVNIIDNILADGEFVAIKSRLFTSPKDKGRVFVDIWRVENGKLGEHWDVIQPIPETALNPASMGCGPIASYEQGRAAASAGLPTCGAAGDPALRAASLAIVTEYLAMGQLSGRAVEAVQRFIADDFVQHSPHIAPGKAGLTRYLRERAASVAATGRQSHTARVIADGEFVLVHRRVTTNTDRRGVAYADLFRVRAGKIVEHWDVIQPIPPHSVSGRSMVHGPLEPDRSASFAGYSIIAARLERQGCSISPSGSPWLLSTA
jgi:AAHS family 4-hydroxybenzoate transporter-like MFS transporter